MSGTVSVRVSRPVWAGTAHGWLMPPDVAVVPDDVAETVLSLDPAAQIEESPKSAVAPQRPAQRGRPKHAKE